MSSSLMCCCTYYQETHQEMRCTNVTDYQNVGRGNVPPKTMNAAECYPMLFALFINLRHLCKLPCSNDFRDKQGVLKLMMRSLHPLYHLPGITSYLRIFAKRGPISGDFRPFSTVFRQNGTQNYFRFRFSLQLQIYRGRLYRKRQTYRYRILANFRDTGGPKSHYGPFLQFLAKMAAKTTSVSGFHFTFELLALDCI